MANGFIYLRKLDDMNKLSLPILTALLLMTFGCCALRSAVRSQQAKDKITTAVIYKAEEGQIENLPFSSGSRIELTTDYDLNGEAFRVPEGVTLVSKGGVIRNGTLYGNKTKVTGDKPFFQNVEIKGTWDVPVISTYLFKDLSYDNSLRDVLALSSSDTYNAITIEEGDYYVTASSFGAALEIPSNTKVILNGRIYLRPNNYRGCYVMNIKDVENVTIEGSGTIIGDRDAHSGSSGEWGHGINVNNSRNVIIKDVAISDCWGDCIYIGQNSNNIVVDGCNLSKGRRQGVSITSGSDIFIRNCTISDVQGTRPQFAIDVEPNKGESLDNVVIENVKAINCYGGFKSWGGAEGAHIGKVTLRNSSVRGASAENPVKFVYGDSLIVEGCDFSTEDKPGLSSDVIKNVIVRGNTIRSTHRSALRVSRANAKIIENNSQLKR